MNLGRARPYIAVKPEGARYLNELEQTLNENQIQIITVFNIQDWGTVARAIYEPQLRSSDHAFNVGFETHLWLVQHLFGNQALVLILETQNTKTDLDSQTRFVNEVRDRFRNKLTESSNNTFVVAINLDRLPGKAYIGAGILGQLGIFNPKSSFVPLVEVNFAGRWDNHFFKYIHAPGNANELTQEWNTLKKLGILSRENKISKREWGLLKFLQSVIPPSRYTKTKRKSVK